VGVTASVTGQQVSFHNDLPPLAVVMLAVGLGAALGLLNGVLVAYGNIPSIVVTLGTLAIYRGVLVEYGRGVNVLVRDLPKWLVDLPRVNLFSLGELTFAIVTWDSPVLPEGENLFVAQVDFSEAGGVMADMALHLLGDEGGQFAILSATPDASNQKAWIEAMKETLASDDKYANLDLVDTVYGNDVPEDSYNEALGLVDKYPDLKLIMAPTTVGIAAAAKAMQDEDMCGQVMISGLGLPSEMQAFVENGCAQEFALWSFKDSVI
jgi:hypothetical protein